ncbi:MAG TPA: DUF4159 domain-containing protein [Terriglobales bacterium]|nr:DUF4159 domain-containing protein [Terriglobales bacterium]
MKLAIVLLCVAVAAFAVQFGGYQGYGRYQPAPTNERAEFAWSRLQYDPAVGSSGGFGGYGYGFRRGRRGLWSTDYPKADRTFLDALKRLTRINARSYEQPVSLSTDDVFNYPFLYAVQVQSWTFTPPQAQKLHDYLLKGGFLMVDDFHGTADWDNFMLGMRMVFPNRPVVDLPDNDEIFHVLYNLDDKFQVPGEQFVNTGRTYEKDGYVPKWRAIRDDDGRVMVAICHNMHLGDAWEWADSPQYPEKFAGMAFRIGVNYVMYSMTH